MTELYIHRGVKLSYLNRISPLPGELGVGVVSDFNCKVILPVQI